MDGEQTNARCQVPIIAKEKNEKKKKKKKKRRREPKKHEGRKTSKEEQRVSDQQQGIRERDSRKYTHTHTKKRTCNTKQAKRDQRSREKYYVDPQLQKKKENTRKSPTHKIQRFRERIRNTHFPRKAFKRGSQGA
jgi:hypothetical protein